MLFEIVESGATLSQLTRDVTLYPQEMINVPLRQRGVVDSEKIQRAVVDAEARLADRGRVLLRPSGTEPLVRVMVEGQDAEEVAAVVEELAQVVRQEVGEPRFI